MTEEEFDALAKLPLCDLVDAMKSFPMLHLFPVIDYNVVTTGDAPLYTLRESIQEEWDW